MGKYKQLSDQLYEKTGFMYTKYTCSYYCKYLPYCKRYSQYVSFMRFLTNCCINGEKFVRLLCLHKQLFYFEIQKCGLISCAHKTHFLMPGHIYNVARLLYTGNNSATCMDDCAILIP